MLGSGRVKVALAGAMGALLACGIASGALAASATPPTLRVKVSPATLRPHQSNRVYLMVTYDKKTTSTPPYLKAYIQFSGKACRGTAKAEAALRNVESDWAGAVTNSPFTRWDKWTMGTLRGTRRVCAYLYAIKNDSKPLLTATSTYRVV
jgi:hypothetical protein